MEVKFSSTTNTKKQLALTSRNFLSLLTKVIKITTDNSVKKTTFLGFHQNQIP